MGRALPHERRTDFQTWKVDVTAFGGPGNDRKRRRKFLVPARNAQEAEQRARARIGPAAGGYHVKARKVADYWREYE